jgi:hypothetical protein
MKANIPTPREIADKEQLIDRIINISKQFNMEPVEVVRYAAVLLEKYKAEEGGKQSERE